jgi:hypothetical protein
MRHCDGWTDTGQREISRTCAWWQRGFREQWCWRVALAAPRVRWCTADDPRSLSGASASLPPSCGISAGYEASGGVQRKCNEGGHTRTGGRERDERAPRATVARRGAPWRGWTAISIRTRPGPRRAEVHLAVATG